MENNSSANDPYGINRGVVTPDNSESPHTATVVEAARRIQESKLLEDDPHHQSPEERHQANFIGRVCDQLGIERTVENFARVDAAMDKLGIEPHAGHEYPKYVKTGKKVQVFDFATNTYFDGKKDEEVIVHDADEERAAMAGDSPANVDDAGRPAPAPHTDVPTSGVIPTPPEDIQPPQSVGFMNAGSGKLDATENTLRKPPVAPQRRAT